eukprot:CCRYP_006835-RA/>CCRYP_006835-RA protein AED:0.02 eAED:0.02 QI:694/1/1/1/1/1/2/740/353
MRIPPLNPSLVSSVVTSLDPVKTSHTSRGLATSDSKSSKNTKSAKPTNMPAMIPTPAPSTSPSKSPSTPPSNSPTTAPSKSPSKAPSMSPTSSPSKSPTTSPSSPPGYRRRALMEGEERVKEQIPLERRLEIIEEMAPFGAKSDSSFFFTYDLISRKSCDALIEYMDKSLEHVIERRVELPVGSSTGAEHLHDAWTPFEDGISNQFDKKLYAEDLVELIGREETLKIIDFFEQSLGNLTIDCLYLARHAEPAGDLYLVPWHVDDYATLEITLNDNYEGGHVLHLNADGVHKTDNRPGSATAHMDDIVHGITPNTNGAKYMLIVKHHFNHPEKEGVVRLSRDIVDAIEISRLSK